MNAVAARTFATREKLGDRAVSRRVALTALAVLAATYVALAVPVAAPGSTVVLATAERSPGWLLGPWRLLGSSSADGALAGPLFYAGLWLAIVAYVAVLACAGVIGRRLAIGSIVAFHVLFMLAPPLLSQDVFSYLAYARLGVLHHLNPYTHSPDAVPSDATFAFAGSKNASSVYGPLFTIATYPLAKLGVPVAFWTLKAVAALSSLGVVALAWRCAELVGRDPVFVALAIGLNPLILVHVVGGAHNDGLVVLLSLAGMLALLGASAKRSPQRTRARERAAGFLAAGAAGLKASAGLVLPFLVLASRRRLETIAGAVAAAVAIAGASVAVFGTAAFDAFGLLGHNQERTSRWSVPQKVADGLGGITGASPDTLVHFTRGAFAVAFGLTLVILLRRTLRSPPGAAHWIGAAGWSTLALLVASAWLVPWYAVWLIPLAALSESRRLLAASIALCAYMLVIAVPL